MMCNSGGFAAGRGISLSLSVTDRGASLFRLMIGGKGQQQDGTGIARRAGQEKRCERSYLLGKYISSSSSHAEGKGQNRVTGFAQERIRKMPQKERRGTKKKLCHSKIDSLLLPDSFCVEGESAAGIPRLGREQEQGHNEQRSEEDRGTGENRLCPQRVTIKVTSLLDLESGKNFLT